MNERVLMIICLTASVTGIFLIFFSNIYFQPKIISISEVDKNMAFVIIEGQLTQIETGF